MAIFVRRAAEAFARGTPSWEVARESPASEAVHRSRCSGEVFLTPRGDSRLCGQRRPKLAGWALTGGAWLATV